MDLDKWIEQLWDCRHLDEAQMAMLCNRLIDILIEESNVQVRWASSLRALLAASHSATCCPLSGSIDH